MRSFGRVALALVFSLFAEPPFAHAQKRVALVIGNSAYQHTPQLTNPRSDATDMVAALKTHGFQIIEGFDLDKSSFDRKVRDFAEMLSGAKVGVFFYAGHGLQVAGQNYLVPIDAKLSTGAALDWEMVRLDLVQRTMEREAETNLLFLDACRDNPLARNLARAMGTRSADIGRGLAATEAGVGTLISFSTQPGNVALDGTGRNSPFAKALVKQLGTSNDDLSAILIAVRNDVMSETQRRQVPWEHSALTGRFYFNAAAATAVATAPGRLNEAAETSPSRTPPFDGIWTIKKVCPQMTDGTRGYTQEFVAEVKGGVLHGESGVKDKPGWSTFDGKIQPDGSAWIKERGVTAERVGQSPRGAPYAFDMLAQLDATRGTGKRVFGRKCDFTFAKR